MFHLSFSLLTHLVASDAHLLYRDEKLHKNCDNVMRNHGLPAKVQGNGYSIRMQCTGWRDRLGSYEEALTEGLLHRQGRIYL